MGFTLIKTFLKEAESYNLIKVIEGPTEALADVLVSAEVIEGPTEALVDVLEAAACGAGAREALADVLVEVAGLIEASLGCLAVNLSTFLEMFTSFFPNNLCTNPRKYFFGFSMAVG